MSSQCTPSNSPSAVSPCWGAAAAVSPSLNTQLPLQPAAEGPVCQKTPTHWNILTSCPAGYQKDVKLISYFLLQGQILLSFYGVAVFIVVQDQYLTRAVHKWRFHFSQDKSPECACKNLEDLSKVRITLLSPLPAPVFCATLPKFLPLLFSSLQRVTHVLFIEANNYGSPSRKPVTHRPGAIIF